MCEMIYKLDWELFGGVVEFIEFLYVGVVWECWEELGIFFDILGMLSFIDWMFLVLGWFDVIEFIYDVGVVELSFVKVMYLVDLEISCLYWVELQLIFDYVIVLLV